MMKHSSHQFGDQFSGFGCQSEKFGHIGARLLGAISCSVQSWSWNKHMPLCKLLICFNGDKDIVTSFVWNQWWGWWWWWWWWWW